MKSEVLLKARDLREMLLKLPEVSRYQKAIDEYKSDSVAQGILNDLQNQMHKVQYLEAMGQPLEPEDKRVLATLQQSFSLNRVAIEFTQAYDQFMQLMEEVYRTLMPIDEPEEEEHVHGEHCDHGHDHDHDHDHGHGREDDRRSGPSIIIP
ncbi:MAG: YlbF family regulator [Planctomycetes bacterium]|nr:YlbF family regulator [Planctomycetota bacterium]